MSMTRTKTKPETASKKTQVEAVGTAQQEPAMAQPQREHEWLQKLVGEWTWEGEMTMEPGKAPVKSSGTETVRPLGDLWILADGQGEMPGCGNANTLMTLGYNPQKERFVGTFVASMMTHMWIYDGALDADEKVLTLDTEGPSMAHEGEMGKFRDVIEIVSDDHRILSSHILGDDGQWRQFMTAHYCRQQ